MSSKSTEPRSIASQLVFLFAPAAAFLLCCGLGVLYWIVVRHAYAEDRAVLSDKVLAIRTDLNSADGPRILNQELKAVHGGERAVLLGASARFHPARCGRDAGNEPLAAGQAFFPETDLASDRATAQRLSNRREIILVSLSRDRSKRPALSRFRWRRIAPSMSNLKSNSACSLPWCWSAEFSPRR